MYLHVFYSIKQMQSSRNIAHEASSNARIIIDTLETILKKIDDLHLVFFVIIRIHLPDESLRIFFFSNNAFVLLITHKMLLN